LYYLRMLLGLVDRRSSRAFQNLDVCAYIFRFAVFRSGGKKPGFDRFPSYTTINWWTRRVRAYRNRRWSSDFGVLLNNENPRAETRTTVVEFVAVPRRRRRTWPRDANNTGQVDNGKRSRTRDRASSTTIVTKKSLFFNRALANKLVQRRRFRVRQTSAPARMFTRGRLGLRT